MNKNLILIAEFTLKFRILTGSLILRQSGNFFTSNKEIFFE